MDYQTTLSRRVSVDLQKLPERQRAQPMKNDVELELLSEAMEYKSVFFFLSFYHTQLFIDKIEVDNHGQDVVFIVVFVLFCSVGFFQRGTLDFYTKAQQALLCSLHTHIWHRKEGPARQRWDSQRALRGCMLAWLFRVGCGAQECMKACWKDNWK